MINLNLHLSAKAPALRTPRGPGDEKRRCIQLIRTIELHALRCKVRDLTHRGLLLNHFSGLGLSHACEGDRSDARGLVVGVYQAPGHGRL
jgi:hypothetical protein